MSRVPPTDRFAPPYKVAGAVFLVVIAAVAGLIYAQFRGSFESREVLTVVSPRAGLVVDPGSKVTFNGVEIGRVTGITTTAHDDGRQQAMVTLEVSPRYLHLIPSNVVVDYFALGGFEVVDLTTNLPIHQFTGTPSA